MWRKLERHKYKPAVCNMLIYLFIQEIELHSTTLIPIQLSEKHQTVIGITRRAIKVLRHAIFVFVWVRFFHSNIERQHSPIDVSVTTFHNMVRSVQFGSVRSLINGIGFYGRVSALVPASYSTKCLFAEGPYSRPLNLSF